MSGPIFILGAHRSGTTWLHQLLAETGQVDFLMAHHVFSYRRFPQAPPSRSAVQSQGYSVLAAELRRQGIVQRGFDQVRITPEAPEEYNFVLSNAGMGWQVSVGNLGLLLELCARIRQAPDGAPARPLVLKSPWDYANFVSLKAALPASRYIFVHRRPERVVESVIRTSRNLLRERHPYLALLSREYERFLSRPARLRSLRLLMARRFGIGVGVVTRLVASANRYYVRHVAGLPEADALSVRYEDLCADPLPYRARLLAFCNLDPERLPATFTPPAPSTAPLSAEVRRRRATIERSSAAYMRLLGYPPG